MKKTRGKMVTRVKYRKHPSFTTIGKLNVGSYFHLSIVNVDEVLKEILKNNP